MIYENVFFIFIILAIAIIFLIMLQQNDNASFGSSFRQNSLQNMFRATYSGNFITKCITILAVLFFVFSLILNNLNNKNIDEWKNINIKEFKKIELKKP